MPKVKTSWKPGESGNPNGRPLKGYSITETIKAMLKAKPEIKQALGNKILSKALQGDVTAIKMLWQYMDGMPAQTMKLEGDKEEPILIKLTLNQNGPGVRRSSEVSTETVTGV